MKILQNRGEKSVNYQSSCELSHIQQKIILEKQAKATIIVNLINLLKKTIQKEAKIHKDIQT